MQENSCGSRAMDLVNSYIDKGGCKKSEKKKLKNSFSFSFNCIYPW